jgi:ubiquinone/menaquinone biosynthesis C-methylase UbiE
MKVYEQADNTEAYDEEAEASNWFGPEIVFGLSFKYVTPGDKILDIGIGTGLCAGLYHKAGFEVSGMDISDEMLDICRKKQISKYLVKHDLTQIPYPFESNSVDHAVCTGVMQFFKDLNPIFQEASRIIRNEGSFSFIVAHQENHDESEIQIGPEHTHSGAIITMYRHSTEQINRFINQNKFDLKRSLEFSIYMDQHKSRSFKAKAYVLLTRS